MYNLKFGFSWIGIIVFILPMLINIVYFLLPPANAPANAPVSNKLLELVEQGTRILYMLALVFIVCKDKPDFKSPWLYLGLICLVLYYIVWIRYFIGGRDVALMNAHFLFIPQPLAIFPVLFFLFEAIWMQNFVAAGCMVVFGIAHNIITYQSFH